MTALARRLAQRDDIKLTIVSVSPSIPYTERFTHEGIDYIYVKVPVDKYDLLTGYQQRIRRVQQVLEEAAIPADVVHIHGSELQYQVMAANLSAPKLLSVQGIMSECIKVLPTWPDYRHLSWRMAEYYERQYLPKIDHFICRTHWDTAIMRRKSANAVIHQNWEMMREPFYSPVEHAEHATSLLYMGGLNTLKGIRELLMMYDQLAQEEPFLRLVVTGTGNKQGLVSLIDQLKLVNIRAEQIEHRGFLDASQLWQAYHEAMCLVHPSHVDNSPNSICEAQLAGLPVVATNVGGVSSLIEHTKTGILSPLNPTALADAVMYLFRRPEARKAIRIAARQIALKRHDPDTIVDNTCAIYSTITRGQTAPASHVFVS
ncbi:glycosyltransferase family 4 protein [Fibrella sp. HMF5335]|uniref:Glycosyltransferase family 4 protein n=1 Tax=Fibrella rubiginis TaxID=2817060 RepID=A0A939GL53_9BACT|nr:glycosyltransferase family 4 protein [Fibrella rubiginis]MBO0938820.1 glycosyltransferase family 4 protein [Fibrella rubiginis]